MIDYVREPFLNITHGLSFLHSKELILLDKSMLSGSLDIIPSCVTSRMSHISFAELHCDTLKNSSQLKADVIILLAIQSNFAFLLSASVHSNEGLSIKTSSLLT